MPTTTDSGSAPRADERHRFASLIEPYRPALQAYCRSIARSSWEADDLVQDTWLKAYTMFLRKPSRSDMSKTYLFRIAHNTWIDRCRRQRRTAGTLGDEPYGRPEETIDPIELRSAMEALVANLPARQRILLLLVDMFGYSAADAAKLLRSTEGAVKAGLHRARAKLKSVSGGPAGAAEEENAVPVDRSKVDEIPYMRICKRFGSIILMRL